MTRCHHCTGIIRPTDRAYPITTTEGHAFECRGCRAITVQYERNVRRSERIRAAFDAMFSDTLEAIASLKTQPTKE